MSGRQAKVNRRQIRIASEAKVREMQEQQENAIMSALQRCNELTQCYQTVTAKLRELEARLIVLEPPAKAVD